VKKRVKKRALTLLEIMIVICLITLITGVIGYNMKGSLDKGKAFRTEQAMTQLQDMLLLVLSEGISMEQILKNPEDALKSLGLARDPANLLKDGWNKEFSIRANAQKSDFIIRSNNLNNYYKRIDKKNVSLADESESDQE
jgi:type II secretory pathway pseudopilin PulG